MKQAECSQHLAKAVNTAVGEHAGYTQQKTYLGLCIVNLGAKNINRTEGRDFYTIKPKPLLQQATAALSPFCIRLDGDCRPSDWNFLHKK